MSIKGSAVKATKEYILKKQPEHYDEWLKGLSKSARDILSNPILATEWYPIDQAVVGPTEVMSKMFFNSVKECAWELGRFSADQALSGIYKVFVLISTPQFILSRAAKVFQSYYKDSEIVIKEQSNTHVILQIKQFPYIHQIMEYRIAGWISGAIDKTGHKIIKVEVTKSMTKGEEQTEIHAEWTK
jgi:hypothetical protein